MSATVSPPEAFTLAPLPYATDALEPVIDQKTMEIHHDKHHAAYVKNLNQAVAADPALQGQSLEALLANASRLPAAVRNNGGGHYNHSLFWTLMAPVGQGGEPSAALRARIDQDFGSWDKFVTAFEEAGLKRFGSGWAWLVWSDGRLQVISTPNQDNPLMDLAEVKGAPILANDVWEHAYYLKHQNKRGDYLKGWWQVVNWERVNALFAAAAQ
ncbi:MAG TPA: superoxide dismutase [Chromatiaceae bacterium]|nr:superoxide dismutase [Chromatiaceae bacterium]